ncbi:pyridoxamine 5'-phosphate oxidase family protein [Alcaligenes sp. Lyrl_28]|uniref:pyridoxamine 5'-phosphate oxidase family protein n=1 Tax=Alcaligenes sp. Lyrl_28 TaxID=3110924 RepID=UPI0026580798|nr:pyridoxamine 5'-phosphate oxidase family protein [Alcaligenes faecalis]
MSMDDPLLLSLQRLLRRERTASLGTLSNQGLPVVSRVPFAICPEQANIIIHISEMAAHTRYLMQRPDASLMVSQSEHGQDAVHDLPRVTFQVLARQLERGQADFDQARKAYIRRFPDMEFLCHFTDFHFFALDLVRVRHIAGFAAARTLKPEPVRALLAESSTGQD